MIRYKLQYKIIHNLKGDDKKGTVQTDICNKRIDISNEIVINSFAHKYYL